MSQILFLLSKTVIKRFDGCGIRWYVHVCFSNCYVPYPTYSKVKSAVSIEDGALVNESGTRRGSITIGRGI